MHMRRNAINHCLCPQAVGVLHSLSARGSSALRKLLLGPHPCMFPGMLLLAKHPGLQKLQDNLHFSDGYPHF